MWCRRRWILTALLLGLALASVARARAQGGGEGTAPPGRRPSFAEIHARTRAAIQLRYVCEVLVDTPGQARVRLLDEGAIDRRARRLWRSVALARGDDVQPALRIAASGGALYIQPTRLAVGLGLEPGDWVGTQGLADGTSPWSAWSLPPAATILRDLLVKTREGETVRLGEETIRKTVTTHWRGSVVGSGLVEPLAGLPVDMWVDSRQRLRRLETTIAVEADDQAASRMTLRLDLFDYGEPVEVDLPDETAVASNDVALLRTVLALLRS